MDEKQFKILTEKLDEIVKYLEKISRYTIEADGARKGYND